MRIICDFGTYPLIMTQYQVASLIFFRVSGVDLTFPDPLQFEHRFLKSPLPVAPEPWQTEQVTIQSSARSYDLLGTKITLLIISLYMCKINRVFTFSIAFFSTNSILWLKIMLLVFVSLL